MPRTLDLDEALRASGELENAGHIEACIAVMAMYVPSVVPLLFGAPSGPCVFVH